MNATELQAWNRLPPDEKRAYDQLHRMAANGEARSEDLASTNPDSGKANTHVMLREGMANVRQLLTSGGIGAYAQLSSALERSGTPQDRQRLAELVVSGRAISAAGDGHPLLSQLQGLARGGQTALGMDRGELLRQTLSDLVRPDQVMQGAGNLDCAGTAAGSALARTQPAEYARVVSSLAERGSAALRSGDRLDVAGPEAAAGNRSLTQQLFARAFTGGPQTGGVHASQLQQSVSGLTGREQGAMYLPGPGQGTAADRAQLPAAAKQVLDEHARSGTPAYANLEGAHWVVVTGEDRDAAGDRVRFVDGSGQQKSLPAADFVQRLNSLVFDAGVSQPQALGQSAWGKPGGDGSPKGGASGAEDRL